MDEQRGKELVDFIFDHHFNCIIAPVLLDAAIPAPAPKHEVRRSTAVDGVVTLTTTNPNERRVLERMFGSVRYDGTEEQCREVGAAPIAKMLSPDQMAEVVAIDGSFILDDYEKAAEIVDNLDEYTATLRQMQRDEFHYMGPGVEDIDKLTALANALRPLGNRISALGRGTGDWAELRALFTRTGQFEVGASTENFFAAYDNGDLHQSLDASPMPTGRPAVDPYKF